MAKEVLEMEVKSNIGEVAKDTKKLTTESTKAQKGVGGIGKAFKGMGTAIKAAGIGLVVALLAKLMEVFSKNQTVLDTFNTAMTALSIAFNDLFGFISNSVGNVIEAFKSLFEDPKQKIINLGDAIKANIMERVESAIEMFGFLGKAIKQVFEGDFSGAMDSAKEAYSEYIDVWTGVDNTIGKVSDSIKNATESIKEYVTETLTQADAITQTAKAAGRAEVEFARLNAKYLKDAEIQRQIRDDETKTFEERIEANNKLSKVLDEQAKDQAKQVQVKIDNAQAQFNINKSEENFLELGRAKNEMLELEETITGQLSEQKTNQVSLEKELLETQKEVRAEGLTGLERELQDLQDAYDLKLEMARKSGMDTTAITKKFESEKTQIVKSNENLKLAAISGFADSVNKIAGEQKAIAVATALMNTYLGVTEVMKDPTIPSTTMKFLAAGTVLAGGLANVQNILKQDVGSGSGGGGGNVAGSSAPAPQMMSGAFDISGGVAPEATKAYVVTDEMTNSQNQLANIRRRATI
jgi:hypothetical protein